jgi:hypothetical protein
MDLLTICTHHSEVQARTALSLISTFYKSLAHAKCSLSSLDVSWKQILTMEVLQLLCLRIVRWLTLHSTQLHYSALSSQLSND